MSYLPDNPSLQRHPELYQPVPFSKTAIVQSEPAPRAETWSANAFWYTVLFLGCMAVTLMAWGAYSALPRPGITEKNLRAEHALPKLKMEMRTQEPPLAESIQVAAMEPPPPPPVEPGAPISAPVKIELPAPTPEPTKIELPPVPMPEPMPVAAPTPMKLDLPPLPLPPAIPSPPVNPAPMPIAAVEAVVPVLPVQQEPTIFLGRANPGETPMIRNWKMLALYSLLAVAPVAAPTPVVAAGGADEKTQKRIDEMLTLMGQAIKAINTASEGIGELRKDIRASQAEIDNLKTTAVKLRADVDGSGTRMDDLQKLINNLDAEVKHLRKRVNENSLQSLPPSTDKASLDELKKHLLSIEQAIRTLKPAEPTSRVALSPPAATGKVNLVNLYHEELLFVINQKTHRVPPGAGVMIESVPAGALAYEVISPTWGQRARTTATLPANETFTLTAR